MLQWSRTAQSLLPAFHTKYVKALPLTYSKIKEHLQQEV